MAMKVMVMVVVVVVGWIIYDIINGFYARYEICTDQHQQIIKSKTFVQQNEEDKGKIAFNINTKMGK